MYYLALSTVDGIRAWNYSTYNIVFKRTFSTVVVDELRLLQLFCDYTDGMDGGQAGETRTQYQSIRKYTLNSVPVHQKIYFELSTNPSENIQAGISELCGFVHRNSLIKIYISWQILLQHSIVLYLNSVDFDPNVWIHRLVQIYTVHKSQLVHYPVDRLMRL